MNVPLNDIITITKTAGERVMELRGKAKVEQKGATQNLVTEADTLSERYLSGSLQELVSGSKVLGEESSNSEDLSSEDLWIIDPLDGTNNFAHTIPQFGVSVAYSHRGIVEAGVVFDPCRNECFSAVRGGGAFLNNQSISVSNRRTLNDSMISTGFYYDRGILMERTLLSIHRLFKVNIRGIRRFGAASLDICWVACGRFDGYFEYQLSPWDFAAGQLIVREAGGVCCDHDGVDRGVYSTGLICSNGLIHQFLLEQVKQREEYWNQGGSVM